VAPGQELGIICPHVTEVAAGQLGTHSHIRVGVLQRRPVGQRVPAPGQVSTPHVSVSGRPQSTPAGAAHCGTHSHIRVVVLQRRPAGHIVPTPQEGPPGQTLAISVPQATEAGLVAQRGVQTQRPSVHIWPAGQSVPVPGHARPAQSTGIVDPQVTVAGAWQPSTHSQAREVVLQRWPAGAVGQRVPTPHDGPPGHRLTMS
jgi:hypothetical protein